MAPQVRYPKEIPVNKLTKRNLAAWVSAGLMFGASLSAYSQSNTNLCNVQGTVFVFFNGVQTTPDQADVGLAEFRRIHGTTTPAGEPIRYEKFYNYSNGFEDFVETFEQRLAEQGGVLEGKFELFFEALNGDGPWWRKIIDAVASTGSILTGFVDWYKAAAIANLTTLFSDPPTQVNYAEHKARIDNYVLEGKKMLFVAHSQGNLFVNPAYSYAKGKLTTDSVRTVHIAPASPLLSGEHTLADLDLVINGLRTVGTVASVTDSIPGYLERPAGVTGSKDILGHGLIPIYLNEGINVSSRVKGHINSALSALVPPPATATTGFFTATLTWDGPGDVDLHTYEPAGGHVFYGAKVGASGYLDVDNTVSNGPEHYYATCNSANLQPGTYQIAVANYSRATGRTATVQVASWADGVLGTRSITLGGETGNIPSSTLFSVVVTQDGQTGQYKASLAQ